MSPRAACRLEQLGFSEVYDYAAGKSDWTASGLPTEGELATMVRPGLLAERDVPTCEAGEKVADVTRRLGDERSAIIVTCDDGSVIGRIQADQLDDPAALVGDVMEPGPTTVRHDEFLPDLVERMQQRRVGAILVTDPSGKLIGIMHRAAAEEAIERLKRHHEQHHH